MRLWPFARRATLPAPLPTRAPAVQKRASAVGRLIFIATGGAIVQRTDARYEAHAREGYAANAIVYRCIRLVADALRSVPVMVFDGDKDVTATHELAAVLANPNPQQIWEELVDEIVGHLTLAGEGFLEGVAVRGGAKLMEIYALRPDKVAIEPAPDGGIGAFVYESAAGQKRFAVERGRFSPVLQMRHWHPTDHWRGLAPMAAAANAGDEHNAAVAHTQSLYRNAARPSGALIYAPKEGDGKLSDDQFERLKYELADEHQGVDNAGKPLLLDGWLDWKPMGFSPKDLESGEGRAAAAREIALALGVPPLLLGLPGDNTFANYYEAQLAFWRNTVWPLATFIAQKLTAWVRPVYGPSIAIRFDQESSGLAEAEKRDRWDRITKADFLEIDEKRQALGFAPLPGGKGKVVLVSGALATLDDVIAADEDPETAADEAYGGRPGRKPKEEDDDAQE